MRIALLGYGKMGKIIEEIAVERGHSISIKVTSETTNFSLSDSDIAIDFSQPEVAFKNISNALNNGVPVVSGTTGWLEHYNKAVELCNTQNGAFIYASNFSLGVNIFFQLNKQLAKMMLAHSDYKADITEIHHTEKLDAPSGTAITLANQIIDHTKYTNWKLGDSQDPSVLPIAAERMPQVPGTHTITYKSDIDTIAITHKAHNRKGFALGAVIAAEWLLGKTGVFTMNDVLNIG